MGDYEIVAKMLADLTAERDTAREEAGQLRSLLRRLEWCRGYGPYTNCPVCGWTKDRGHGPKCEMRTALAQATPPAPSHDGAGGECRDGGEAAP